MTEQHPSLSCIGILGLGRSGNAVLQAAQDSGIETFIWDDQQPDSQTIQPEDWPWERLDALVISPGIPHLHPSPHRVAALATRHHTEIISEIEFSLRYGRAGRFVVITGTNGKSTTASLLTHILTCAGKSAVVGGNIGTAVTCLPHTQADDIIVLEASSYQLETTPSLRPEISILLNITPDHLERHGGMDGYIAAKAQLLVQTAETGHVIVGEDEFCTRARMLAGTHAHCTIIDSTLRAEELERQLQARNPALQGIHNTQNCVAARHAARLLGLSDAIIDEAILSFAGLAHRLQPVGQLVQGIQLINDSKATNAEASLAALSSFDNIYWLAGGLAKSEGISPCLNRLSAVTKAYFYGQSAADFAQTAQDIIPLKTYHRLDDAFADAIADAIADTQHHSDENTTDATSIPASATILLSPAAASFDQFASFEKRGEHFISLAQQAIVQHAPPSQIQEGAC